MSRIAKAPVDLPQGVTATIAATAVTIKGAKGSLSLPLVSGVSVVQTEKKLQIKYEGVGAAQAPLLLRDDHFFFPSFRVIFSPA